MVPWCSSDGGGYAMSNNDNPSRRRGGCSPGRMPVEPPAPTGKSSPTVNADRCASPADSASHLDPVVCGRWLQLRFLRAISFYRSLWMTQLPLCQSSFSPPEMRRRWRIQIEKVLPVDLDVLLSFFGVFSPCNYGDNCPLWMCYL